MRNLIVVHLLLFSMTVAAIEQSRLFTMSDLIPYEVDYNPENETYKTKKRLFFYELGTYQYQDDHVFLLSNLSKNRSISGKFVATRFGSKLGFKDFEFELDKSVPNYGNKSELYILLSNEAQVGNYFIAEVGKYIFAFTIIGIQVDSDFLDEIIRPKLLQLESEP